jgi:hypothetical protein
MGSTTRSVPAERRALLSELEREPLPRADAVDPDEYLDILGEAVAARNGWKRILARCAPARRTRQGRPMDLRQAADLGCGDGAYFASLERVLRSVVDALPSLPESARRSIEQRLRKLAQTAQPVAWGYGDSVHEITARVLVPRTASQAQRRARRPSSLPRHASPGSEGVALSRR